MFCAQPVLSKRNKADALVIPFYFANGETKCAAALDDSLQELVTPALKAGFPAKKGEVHFVYTSENKEAKVFFLGLGEELEVTKEKLLEAYSSLTRALRKNSCTSINVILPTVSSLRAVSCEDFIESVCEGMLSLNYQIPQYGEISKKADPVIEKICLVGVVSNIAKPIYERAEAVFEGVYLTRDLVNGNADDVTPEYLANTAKGLSKVIPGLQVSILDKAAILKEGMGLLAAVSRGAAVDPRLIVIKYEGKPNSKDKTVLVGKGVTFDSGGLDLKPGKAMLTMKEDMAGAATVLGIISVVASLSLPLNVTAVIPATENSIGSKAYKMGDVYVGMSGLSVEIGSTDAEGRLILADAITYAQEKLKPTRIIDFATLTGAMVISLGEKVAGFFSNDDVLAEKLAEASDRTSESIWRMPLVSGYNQAISSEVADVKNIGNNRAGAITAALFLQKFVDEKIDWAHFDIAGTAYREKEEDFTPKYASGFGVRLLVSYLESLIS
ncbi:leucyl aminopeptidase [Chlamydiifrater phoenicopteri]|uniref:leucyl aminopeptidase n=1 Tax=Chlamydiifrater phoenicopteri TaxID=2681469 RepID=UPI001BCBA08D|nr:leucyl aminopeptidase [Chlamydiifrater phoenicopteri]